MEPARESTTELPSTRCLPSRCLPCTAVKSTGFVGPRTTIVLQWRLSPLYQLRPGLALGPLLDQFKVSVRERAHQERQERAQQGHEAWACGAEEDIDWAPTIEPSRKYKLYIKQLVSE